MKITADVSCRLDLLRFPLIVGVVYIHAPLRTVHLAGTEAVADVWGVAAFIQDAIVRLAGSTAVPLFFVMSGLLFFRNFSFTAGCIAEKFTRRARTLLLPYLLWNAGVLALFFVMQSLPGLSAYFSGSRKPVSDFGWYDYLNAFLAFEGYPVAFQFWFIRDLMVLVLLSPLVWLIARGIPKLGLAVFFVLWFLDPGRVFNLSYVAVFFFFLGALMSVEDWDLSWIDRHGRKLLAAFALLLLVNTGSMGWTPLIAAWLGAPLVLLGIASAWYLSGKAEAVVGARSLLLWLAPFSFFVYAAHEPLLDGLKKIALKLIPSCTSFVSLAVFLLAPVVAIVLTLLAGYVLWRMAPVAYRTLTGGR